MKMKAIDSIPAPKLSIRLRPEYPGHVGAYDFVEERTHDGRKFRTRCQQLDTPAFTPAECGVRSDMADLDMQPP